MTSQKRRRLWVLGFVIFGAVVLGACTGSRSNDVGDRAVAPVVVPPTAGATVSTLPEICMEYAVALDSTYRTGGEDAGEVIDVTDAGAVATRVAAADEALLGIIKEARTEGCSVADMGLESSMKEYLLVLDGDDLALDDAVQRMLDEAVTLGRTVADEGVYPDDMITQMAVVGESGFQFVGPDEVIEEGGVIGVWADQISAIYVSYAESGTCWAVIDSLGSIKRHLKTEGACSAQIVSDSRVTGGPDWGSVEEFN